MNTCANALDSETDIHSGQTLLPSNAESLLLKLAGRLQPSLCAADENLGHLEEQLLRGGHEVFRQMLEKAAQQKANAAPPLCPRCQNKLSRVTGDHWTTIQTRFGPIRLQRARGYCKRCRKWRFPADALLGLARGRHAITRRAGDRRADRQPDARRPGRTLGGAVGRHQNLCRHAGSAGPPKRRASRWAAGRWNPPAANTKFASSAQASFGPRLETRRS